MKILSALHRELIKLSYYKGYTHEQIASMRGMPVGTVKTRTRHALQQLRHFLQGDQVVVGLR